MQISFVGNIAQKGSKRILGILEDEGYQVFSCEQVTEIEQILDAFKSVRDTILASDIVIADVSVLEKEFSYQLALALEYRRPTILLVSEKHPEIEDIVALKHRNLEVHSYRNDAEMEEILLEFVNGVKESLDAKLFMNIPPSMNKYLDWVATHTRFSKSDVVRNAVEQAAEDDKEYQLFLKSLG